MSNGKRYLKYVKSAKNLGKSAGKGSDYERKMSHVYYQAIFEKESPKTIAYKMILQLVNNQRNEH